MFGYIRLAAGLLGLLKEISAALAHTNFVAGISAVTRVRIRD
jgi:hypothetical protein